MRTHRAPSKFLHPFLSCLLPILHPFLRFLLLILIPSAVSVAQYSLQDAFPALSAFSLPVELVPANDGTGRFFTVEQRGRIHVFAGGAGVSTRKVFLNLSDSASQSGSEMGLLGLAFHPSYSSNGYFYVNYTDSASGKLWSVVSRFQVSATDPDSAVRSSELVLLTLQQPYTNHNGGKILFGPDGYLYIAFGDGGSSGDPQNNAQNRSVILGKILRIDIDATSGPLNYAIPPTNPFAGNVSGYREEIFAYGLRNPWKMSFDTQTGLLWVGDVGQGLWEEVDIITSGSNYGWRLMEGNACYNPSTACDPGGLAPPIWAYPHGGGDISITGGYVYRGSAISPLAGKYVYADYGSGRIWALTFDGVPSPANALLLDAPYAISTFAEDTSGELLVVSYGTGRIYRLIGPATSAEESREQPATFALEQNYPNPFNPATTVKYTIVNTSVAHLAVYDLLGREIAVLSNAIKLPGNYSLEWDAAEVPTGVYFCRLTVNGVDGIARTASIRMLYVR